MEEIRLAGVDELDAEAPQAGKDLAFVQVLICCNTFSSRKDRASARVLGEDC